MASLFTRIIAGELPARFVWKDEVCVAFMTIGPLTFGHTLVVPRLEVDHWVDLPPEVLSHLQVVAQKIGQAQMRAFAPARIGTMYAGFEVPHAHLHVLPIGSLTDLEFRNAGHPDAAELDRAAGMLRSALVEAGHPEAAGL